MKQALQHVAKPQADGRLEAGGEYVWWEPNRRTAILDGNFTADQLEAIANWMRENQRHA